MLPKPDMVKQMSDFVNYCKQYLDINDEVKVQLQFERKPEMKTTAYYRLDGMVSVYCKDRALVDVMRSVAHELVHHKQNLENRITNAENDGNDGSPIENEANAVAGEIIRKYGKIKPEIYL